jgi:excisionase family DNA binding protein
MAIDTSGYITVAEAAERLDLSIEQVRRKLRDGKLRGHRVGNQWFVEESPLRKAEGEPRRLIPPETIERVRRLREEVAEYNRAQGNPPIDVLELIRQHRDET